MIAGTMAGVKDRGGRGRWEAGRAVGIGEGRKGCLFPRRPPILPQSPPSAAESPPRTAMNSFSVTLPPRPSRIARVPLLVAAPGGAVGKTYVRTVELVDLHADGQRPIALSAVPCSSGKTAACRG
jgi:hypothetical protein